MIIDFMRTWYIFFTQCSSHLGDIFYSSKPSSTFSSFFSLTQHRGTQELFGIYLSSRHTFQHLSRSRTATQFRQTDFTCLYLLFFSLSHPFYMEVLTLLCGNHNRGTNINHVSQKDNLKKIFLMRRQSESVCEVCL